MPKSRKRKVPDKWLNLRSFPELRLFDSEQEAGEAYHIAWKSTRTLARILPLLLLFALVFLLISGAASVLLGPKRGSWTKLPLGVRTISSLCAAVVMVTVDRLVSRRTIRRSIREQLVRSGRPVCMECGYDLRGQEEPRCPECGTPFVPDILRMLEGRRRDTDT